MRLGVKHTTQQIKVISDFSGGLNTSISAESIAENQLSSCENVEIDKTSGRLKTVGGTEDCFTTEDWEITAAMHDVINGVFLLVDNEKNVRVLDPLTWEAGDSIGSLTGNLKPKYASWEDGVLIASGGKLQYYNGTSLVTLADSPNSTEVYIRSGRVVVASGDVIRYSDIGDETGWTEDTGDPSTSKFVEAGYKDGGNFIGMASLSTDIIFIKDNRRVYRLNGEYPDWVINEVSRNIECSGRMAFCSVADAVLLLGGQEVQAIQTTDNYGDVKPSNIASLIGDEIQKLPENTMVRYVPPLQQVWAINGKEVLMFDMAINAWFKRRFNTPVVDVVSTGDFVFVVKGDRVSVVVEGTFRDCGMPLFWKFTAQQMKSHNDFLLKRTQVSIIPFSTEMYTGSIQVGGVIVPFPVPEHLIKVYHNYSPTYKNHTKVCSEGRRQGLYSSGEKVYMNPEPTYNNSTPVFSRRVYTKESRNVYRSKFLPVRGYGSLGGFLLNDITLDVAEV